MNPRQPLPAAQVHGHLTRALTRADQAQADAAYWFAEVARRHLYRALGHASLELYARLELGFSDNRLAQFRQLAGALDRFPALRNALADRRLGWTKAQQVARIATPTTCSEWIRRAERLGRRELARAVRDARERAERQRSRRRERQLELAPEPPSDPPPRLADTPPALAVQPARIALRIPSTGPAPDTTITFQLDGIERARYEALVEQLRRQGHHGTRAELLLNALAALAGVGKSRKDAVATPATRIVVRRCPDCETAHVTTGAGPRRLSTSQASAASCDAEVVDPVDGRAWRTVAPSLRRRVLARDDHRCRAPGCRATRFLEIHHIVPRHAGGANRLDNLITLCSRCHRFLHERAATCAGTSAQDISYQWLVRVVAKPLAPTTAPAPSPERSPGTAQPSVAHGSGDATMPACVSSSSSASGPS